MLKRLTQLDYDRDMAFVALDARTARWLALAVSPAIPTARSRNTPCSFGPTCRATALAGHCSSSSSITHARKASNASRASFSARTIKMLTMCREFGFEITLDATDAGVATARLEIAPR